MVRVPIKLSNTCLLSNTGKHMSRSASLVTGWVIKTVKKMLMTPTGGDLL